MQLYVEYLTYTYISQTMPLSYRNEHYKSSVVSEENELWLFVCVFSLSIPLKAAEEFKSFEYTILKKGLCLLLLLNSLLMINFFL